MVMTNNQATTMRAFATLGAYAPQKADYNYILNYINTHGEKGFYQALNDAYASYTDVQLAKMLLDTTYLNQIDLEGDGNTNNLNVATDFIRANAGNRVGAMLDLTRELSKITTGALAQTAKTYNETIEKGYAHTSGISGAKGFSYNFPKKIDGSAENDTFYVDNSGVQQYVIGGVNQASKAVWVFNTYGQKDGDSSQKLGDLKTSGVESIPSWKSELQVEYRGLHSRKIALDDKDYSLTMREVNQAIKQVINNDSVLGKLLAAVDGPDDTLKIISLVDGEHSKNALKLAINLSSNFEELITPEIIQEFFEKNPADPKLHTKEGMVFALLINQFALSTAYQTQMGRSDYESLVTGKDAETVRSHVVEGAGGNDVIVLSSTKAAVHDIVQFNAVFGRDIIVNFAPSGANYDKIDFGLLHRTDYGVKTTLHKNEITSSTAAAVDQVKDGQIRLVQKYVSFGITESIIDNDSAVDVKQLFNDTHKGIEAKQLYIAVDHTTATGDVYQVVDGAGINDVNVTLLGSIVLANHADTSAAFNWGALSDSNFV